MDIKKFIVIYLLFVGIACNAESIKYLPRLDGTASQNRQYNLVNTKQLDVYPQQAYKEMNKYVQTMKYNNSIRDLFRLHWVKPQNLVGHKQVTLVFKRTVKGDISDIEIMLSSGSVDFDNSVITALKDIEPLPYDVVAKNHSKPYLQNFTVDYDNGNLEVLSGLYMGKNKFVGIRTQPIDKVEVGWFVKDFEIYALMFSDFEKNRIKDYGKLVVSVDIDNKGNCVNPYIKVSSGSKDFDIRALQLVNNINNDSRYRKQPNMPHTLEILFANLDSKNLSDNYKFVNIEQEMIKYKDDFIAYLKSKWAPPYNVKANMFNYNYSSLFVEVKKDGSIGDVSVVASSGNSMFDNYAVQTIKNAKRYKPLPSDYDGESITVYISFVYGVKR